MSMGPLVSGTSYVLCLSPLVLEMLQKESKLVIFISRFGPRSPGPQHCSI